MYIPRNERTSPLDGLDPECLDDLDADEIRAALECGAITTDDLEERGFDEGMLFALVSVPSWQVA